VGTDTWNLAERPEGNQEEAFHQCWQGEFQESNGPFILPLAFLSVDFGKVHYIPLRRSNGKGTEALNNKM
jgi:hypothetical protein